MKDFKFSLESLRCHFCSFLGKGHLWGNLWEFTHLTENCAFYTLSKTIDYRINHNHSYIDVHTCTLWESCDSFEIPMKSVWPSIVIDSQNDFDRGSPVSLHWTGPVNCASVTTTCPKSSSPDDTTVTVSGEVKNFVWGRIPKKKIELKIFII